MHIKKLERVNLTQSKKKVGNNKKIRTKKSMKLKRKKRKSLIPKACYLGGKKTYHYKTDKSVTKPIQEEERKHRLPISGMIAGTLKG